MKGRVTAILAGTLAVAASASVCARYRGDIRRARERIRVGAQIAQTARGPIEYAVAGDGPPILVVHGAGGGFDQALDLSRPLFESGFRVIAPSRFGYLGTPLPSDASPAAQADAHAALLDALNVPRAAVFGGSAGAPSAMQFALRYPERTAALVLLVPAAYPISRIEERSEGAMPKQASTLAGLLFDVALKSDFLFWVASRLIPRVVIPTVLATPVAVVESASPDERARVAQVLDHLLPLSARRLGLLNDAAITPHLPRYDLERIAVPALVVGVADDLFGTYDCACYSAEHIPGARLVSFPTGGHLWVGHHQEILAEVAAYLK